MTQIVERILVGKSVGRTMVALGVLCLVGMPVHAASVAARGSGVASRGASTTSRGAAVTRGATTATATVPVAETATVVTETVVVDASEPETKPLVIEDKTSQFDGAMKDIAETMGGATGAAGASALGDAIRRQRAALDAADAVAAAGATAAAMAGRNVCDTDLRNCMKQKCGDDFMGCAGDGDTIWGDKMDACRRNTTCTGEEYSLFTKEIKADRDMNAKLANYTEIFNCGNNYNNCIVTQCGKTLTKCLGKKAGDAIIAQCNKDLKECTTRIDNGLSARTAEVFGNLRVDAEKQVQRDEQRLNKLRDQMAAVCKRTGAMFDERTFDCVYTVNFYANNQTTPYASKKAYAGTSFNCTQDWFGIDITTFKENAYRTTQEQESATMGFMGGGLGVAAGAISSGMINRAIDTQKASKAAKQAEREAGIDRKADAQAKKEADKEMQKVQKESRELKRTVDKNEKKQDKAIKKLEKQVEKDADSIDDDLELDDSSYSQERDKMEKSISDGMDQMRKEEMEDEDLKNEEAELERFRASQSDGGDNSDSKKN